MAASAENMYGICVHNKGNVKEGHKKEGERNNVNIGGRCPERWIFPPKRKEGDDGATEGN